MEIIDMEKKFKYQSKKIKKVDKHESEDEDVKMWEQKNSLSAARM